jgi:hypothetical protein
MAGDKEQFPHTGGKPRAAEGVSIEVLPSPFGGELSDAQERWYVAIIAIGRNLPSRM